MRIKFGKGKQRGFLDKVLVGAACPSLRELGRRINVNYQSLKNYYTERRLLPEELFDALCEISGLKKSGFNFKEVSDFWGQIKGGRNKTFANRSSHRKAGK